MLNLELVILRKTFSNIMNKKHCTLKEIGLIFFYFGFWLVELSLYEVIFS